MDLAAMFLIGLLTAGSAYQLMRSRREAVKRQKLFYSEIIPHISEAQITNKRGMFPELEGIYENMRIRIVPAADNLCYRGLPHLYVKIYLFIDTDILLRILDLNERKHLFPPARFECHSILLGKDKPQFEVFLPGRQEHADLDNGKLLTIISGIKDCSEILVHKNFVRLTLKAATGDRGYYAVLRGVKFPVLILKYSNFEKNISLVLDLCREVSGFEKAG